MLKTRKEKTYLVFIALLAAAIAAVVIIALTTGGKEPIPETPPAPVPTARVLVKEKLVEVEKEVSAETVLGKLNDMGVLITQEYYFTEVVSYSSVKKFLKTDIRLKFTESAYLVGYSGEVLAGLDFSGIRVEKDDEAHKLTVHIPKSEIQSISIDPASFKLYSEKVGLGNPISVEDYNNSLLELEDTARAEALERGLLEQADKNARLIISNFIGSLTGSDYSVEYVTG